MRCTEERERLEVSDLGLPERRASFDAGSGL